MGRDLIADRGPDEVGAIAVETLRDQQVDLTQVDETEVDRDLLWIPAGGRGSRPRCRRGPGRGRSVLFRFSFRDHTTIHMDGVRMISGCFCAALGSLPLHVARLRCEDDLDPAIELSPRRSLVARHRTARSERSGTELIGADAEPRATRTSRPARAARTGRSCSWRCRRCRCSPRSPPTAADCLSGRGHLDESFGEPSASNRDCPVSNSTSPRVTTRPRSVCFALRSFSCASRSLTRAALRSWSASPRAAAASAAARERVCWALTSWEAVSRRWAVSTSAVRTESRSRSRCCGIRGDGLRGAARRRLPGDRDPLPGHVREGDRWSRSARRPSSPARRARGTRRPASVHRPPAGRSAGRSGGT